MMTSYSIFPLDYINKNVSVIEAFNNQLLNRLDNQVIYEFI